MDTRQLECFITVAEELHFGRAAERLHLAQQPLSVRIKQLEDELGVLLFERTTRRVALTAAGEVYLNAARQALDLLQRGAQMAQQVHQGVAGKLVIGYISPTLYNVLPPILQALRSELPDVEIVLRELASPYLEAELRKGTIDLALGIEASDPPGLHSTTLFHDPIMVALPLDHPLCHEPQIPLRALADEPFVTYDPAQKPLALQQLAAICQQADFQPRIVQEALSTEGVIGLVAAGVGITLTVASLRSLQSERVVYSPLSEPTLSVAMNISWRQAAESALVDRVVALAQAVCLPSSIVERSMT
jgi:DNA-binding transcriptional LysR family regulator